MVLLVELATTRSSLPSLFKSPDATACGLTPVANWGASTNCPAWATAKGVNNSKIASRESVCLNMKPPSM